MNIAAIIVGIDGWEKYTEPLLQSIWNFERGCDLVVIDNESDSPYPWYADNSTVGKGFCYTERIKRSCYSAAINRGKQMAIDADWTIVLSNDVLCTGPFAHILAEYDGSDVVGPLLKEVHGFPYLEGWAVAIPRAAWDAVGGWDERFLGSDYEDVAFSTAARQRGFGLVEDKRLPFTHLDQRQRFHVVPDFAGKNAHNRELFLREYAAVTA